MTEPAEKYIDVNGVRLCYFERGTPGEQPTLLLVHATGFHARCWDQTVALLGDRHIIAVDQRGHGRSDNTPPYAWSTYGADLVAFIRALELTNLIGVGHSMGGHVLVQACAVLPERFERLVLADPVILPPEAYVDPVSIPPESHPVSRRRNHFDSWQAFREQLQGRGGYAHFLPAALDDYCRYGLLPNPEGDGLVLACPPIVEASIYSGNGGTPVFEQARAIECPVTLLRAEPRSEDYSVMDFTKSPTWIDVAGEFQHVVDELHVELTHFIPMQDPQLVADHIDSYAGS